MELLLQNGANLGMTPVEIANELCHCAANSETEQIRWGGPSPAPCPRCPWWPPRLPADARPGPALCSRLLKAGADVNAYDYDHRTALHVAAADCNMPVVQLLVEHGKANINLKDRWAGAQSAAQTAD
jgi:ankyrin repeat protein